MSLPRITVATVVKLLIVSLVVGMALAYLDVQPQDILAWTRNKIGDVLGNAGHYFNWALTYILLGAVIVVPIWLVSYLWKAARGSSKG